MGVPDTMTDAAARMATTREAHTNTSIPKPIIVNGAKANALAHTQRKKLSAIVTVPSMSPCSAPARHRSPGRPSVKVGNTAIAPLADISMLIVADVLPTVKGGSTVTETVIAASTKNRTVMPKDIMQAAQALFH